MPHDYPISDADATKDEASKLLKSAAEALRNAASYQPTSTGVNLFLDLAAMVSHVRCVVDDFDLEAPTA